MLIAKLKIYKHFFQIPAVLKFAIKIVKRSRSLSALLEKSRSSFGFFIGQPVQFVLKKKLSNYLRRT